jgi:SAM-dependent MidA family methyltransferase
MLEKETEPLRSIRRAIEQRGPISFAEFMELALYGPRGFYERPPVGERRHFVTSPHVHPVFADLLADGIRACWHELGRPDPLPLVELGAGDGTLATRLRRALADVPKRYVAVERSTGAREALRRLQPPIQVAAALESIDQRLDGVVVANELLDNLPFRWVRRHVHGDVHEVRVAVADRDFVAVERPVDEDDEELVEAIPPLAPGTDGPAPVGAMHLVERLARVLHRGYALFIDYEAGPASEIHGYRGQRPVEDVLSEPGTADITAGVDFRVLAERAGALGLQSFPPVSQRSALTALGYERWARHEVGRQAEAQTTRSGREAVLAWSGRNAAALLVDPAGLGRFRWWLLATADLPPPPWFAVASRRDLEAMAAVPSDPAEGVMSFEDRSARWRPWRRRA